MESEQGKIETRGVQENLKLDEEVCRVNMSQCLKQGILWSTPI
jgi:hypothetical protein